MEFSDNAFYGHLAKGELRAAIHYLKRFPEQAELYGKYKSLFEKEKYLSYDVDDTLNAILAVYQRYYREVFYLDLDAAEAAENMRKRLAGLFNTDSSLDELEEKQIKEAFHSRGLHFLGGRTGGFYGPYIWRETEVKTYDVELPGGVCRYTVKLLDGFLSLSWLAYISFGAVSTGGWTNGDGVINCVKASYDLESENFRVSLLKHEAQHAVDLAAYPGMSSEDLEYRAKLVELIYSRERELLAQFGYEAGGSQPRGGHALAAKRIAEAFAAKNCENSEEVRAFAAELFSKSSRELKAKYEK